MRVSFSKDITVRTALVATIGYMLLKSEVFHIYPVSIKPDSGSSYQILPPESFSELTVYFSPTPQAEPQAAGLGSAFSSPAPQAEPHAPAGFSASEAAHR